jgi:methylglutaconyl-CoA hydratase
MTERTCFHRTDSSGTATITLNRPAVRNALDGPTVESLIESLHELEEQPSIRSIVLTSAGKDFCAGADLNWMRGANDKMTEEGAKIGSKLAELMWALHTHPKPTIAMVRGAAFGGGAGLVACCDIALAVENARFCFSEVRLGLIPAVISPYVMRAIGERMSRRYFLTGERFDAEEAYRIGLVHEIVAADELQAYADELAQALAAGGPCALTRTKELLAAVSSAPLDSNMMFKTAEWIAEVRQTTEAREGIKAFLCKRKASWLQEKDADR